MKRSIREKNSIVISLVFYLILVVWLILFFLFTILSDIKEIENKKINTENLFKDIVDIEKNGLSYEEFKSMTNSNTLEGKWKEILNSISKDFFNKNFKNTTDESFNDFIKNKINNLNSEKNSDLIKENEKQIISILPTYSEWNINIWNKNLTNFEFINYLESIVESFNLKGVWTYGIWKVIMLKDYDIWNTKSESLDSNIYYIPISMNVSWSKSDILDFLYFIKNVWTIEVINNKISINNNSNQLDNDWFKKILAWDKYSKDYNIFEHQLIDISNIKMPKYIDSSYSSRWDEKLVDFIKGNQWNENYEIKTNLRFYVKWQAKYIVLNFIKRVINNYKAINIKVNSMISKWQIKWIELLNFKKNQKLLRNLNIKIIQINKDLRSAKKLEETYKSAISISDLIAPICKKLEWTCKITN